MNLRVWWDIVLQFNLWLCGTSLLMVAATAFALSIPIGDVGVAILLPALLFYFIYVEDRREITPADRTNNPQRSALMERHQSVLLATELAALTAYEALLVYQYLTHGHVGLSMLFLGQLPLVVLAMYSTLKRVPTFDSIAVAATWTFTVLFAVATSTPLTASTDLVAVTVAWFLLVFAGVESRNIEDIPGDTVDDQKTLAGHLGPRYTTYLAVGLKTAGVLIFWTVSTLPVALVVCAYLVLLRVFRSLTRDAVHHPPSLNTIQHTD